MENKQTINKNKRIQLTIFDLCPELLRELPDTGEDEIPELAINRNTIDQFDEVFDEDSEDYRRKLSEFSEEITEYEEKRKFELEEIFNRMVELKILIK